MKRFCLLLAALLPALTLASCASPEPSPELPGTLRIGALRGATAMGMTHWIENAGEGVSFEIATPDEIVPMLVQGRVDMAAIPANMAAALYNNTGGTIRVAAINTLGLTYIVETGDTVQSVADLRGRTVVATGKSTVTEYTLRHILTQNGLDPDRDVTLEFKSEPAEALAHLRQHGGIAMLPQPFVTSAMDNVPGLREALDLTAEWDKLPDSGTLVVGVLAVRADFLDEYPDVFPKLVLPLYRSSAAWVNANPAQAAPLIEALGVAAADVAERAIPKCRITFIEGAEMKRLLEPYLAVLFEAAPESVGGALPGDDFYVIP
ncbi:MAG: PhnD/SsuA/transferrin family substrate-binding protein [Oscillospiraceae bacterium]|nr:PhnD/SsuA/transferrin family substrate-binding protein [Oscillospiraceae bacterium]